MKGKPEKKENLYQILLQKTFESICESQHKSQQSFFNNVILEDSIVDQNYNTTLSSSRMAKLKDVYSRPYFSLSEKEKEGLYKTVEKNFSPIISFIIAQQLGNIRLATLVQDIRELLRKEGNTEAVSEIDKKLSEWGEDKNQGANPT